MFGSRVINDQRWLFWLKSLKIGQLQMGLESRESIMHSGFFRLKRSFTIDKQEKLHIESLTGDHPSKKFPSDHDQCLLVP